LLSLQRALGVPIHCPTSTLQTCVHCVVFGIRLLYIIPNNVIFGKPIATWFWNMALF